MIKENKRMAKNWENVFNNKIGVTKKDNKKDLNKLMSQKALDFEGLKKHGDALYTKKIEREEHLIALYNEKKLINKNLIKEVRNIMQRREQAEQKKKSESVAQ